MEGSSPSRLDPIDNTPLPGIAALFLVKFDNRKGYTVAWHESITGVNVEGEVEFKSLPSGLHNVEEDLVYFVLDEYAGLSAFINKPDENEERNARMLAIGVLVPLEHGRMGKSWRHAEGLKELARQQVEHPDDTTALEEFWNQNKLADNWTSTKSPSASRTSLINTDGTNDRPIGYQKSRSMSTGTIALSAMQGLSPHHPATALIESLRLFGPLIFPLYRAALLRKRILFVGEAPVEFTCNLVYNLSILSSLPKANIALLPLNTKGDIRMRPLFNIGVQDIPFLESLKSEPSGWIACTTDDVLRTKPDLFDVLVLLPNAEARQYSKQKAFPKIIQSSPELSRSFPKVGIRSTQRDARRYTNLREGLRRFPSSLLSNEQEYDDRSSIASDISVIVPSKQIVEPATWSQVAYTSLVWWASAGDRKIGLLEEEELENENDLAMVSLNEEDDDDSDQTKEVALVGYFHRLTNATFTAISQAIARTDDNEDQYHDEDEHGSEVDDNEDVPAHGESDSQVLLSATEESDETIEIGSDDIVAMGLDIWSESDRKFTEDFISLWWNRKAIVRSGTIECCGMRIL